MKIRDWKSGGGYLRGIDVSAYQGTINYAKVKSNGIKYAILRAYGSANSPDKKIVEYARGFNNVGIPCGSYFFCTISNEYDLSSAISQANKYADKLEEAFGTGSWGQLLPFLDLENNANVGGRHANLNTTQMLKWVDQFRKTFEARFDNKVKLGIYTSWYFIKDHNNFNNGSGGNILKDMPLWMAKWRTTSIPDVGGWTNWVLWQYTDNASPFNNGQAVGVSSTGLDMNYVESLDHIRVISQSVDIDVSRPTATLLSNNSIEVKWKLPSLTGMKKIEVLRNGILLDTVSGSVTSYTDSATDYGKNYSYSIVVYTDHDKETSPASNVITTQLLKSNAPVGLTGIAGDRYITLSWEPNPVSENVKGYTIYMNGTKADYTTKTEYTFWSLNNEHVYTFQVQAHNENPIPSEKSNVLEIAPIRRKPLPPSNLTTRVLENGDIRVNWTYVDEDLDFDYFYIAVDGKIVADNLPIHQTEFIIKGLPVNVSHDLYVCAVDKQVDITTSHTVTRTIHQPPKIKGIKGTVGDRRVRIEWDKPNFYFPPNLPLVPPPPRPKFNEDSVFYIVQENDSIDYIADIHNTDYSLIVSWNDELFERGLIAGETLWILFTGLLQGQRYYRIQNNDTFDSIANKFGMTQAELQAFNPDTNPDSLIIGYYVKVINPTQPPVITTIEYRTENRTRIVQKTVTEQKQVATTKLIEPTVTPYENLKQNALTLTALFETSLGFPQAFGRTAGNFDGAGMSFGAIQYNFKSGTLQPILKSMFDKHTQVVKNAFNYNSNPSYFNTVKNVVYNMSKSQQINWGSSITSGTGIKQPYKDFFYQLGITPECIALQVKGADSYFNQAKSHFKKFGLTTRRAFALCFDIAIQNWSISSSTASRIFNDFKSISSSLSHEQKETKKMQIIANRRAEASNSQWVEDVRSRKLAIANGTGTVHGFNINTADYDLILEPAFLEDQGTFAVPETTYETITVEKVISEEESYTVQVPYVVATEVIPIGEVFVEKELVTEPPAEIDKFMIYQDDDLVGALDKDINFLEITGLENGQTYNYRIQGISTQNLRSPVSDTLNLTPVIDYPNQATNLQAEIIDKKTIRFSWNLENSANFSHLEVLLNGKIVSTDSAINMINYIEAKSNFDYTLEIITYDLEGDSVSSGTITQRIDIPNMPTGLIATPKDREMILNWDSNQEDFVMFYNILLGGEVEVVVDATENSYKMVGLQNDILYDFRIQAVSNKGFVSEISEPIFATPILDVPNKPTITYHKELGNGGAELNWEHSQKEGHSHYNVYKNGYLIASDITDNKYLTDYLESNMTHIFHVEAFDFQGDQSGFSENYPVTIYAKILEPLSTELGKVDSAMPVSKPKIYLCTPNKKVIAYLNESYGLIYNTRYADLNEITFNIPYEIETTTNELIENEHYRMVKERFLIKLEYRFRTEYFIINQISNVGENNAKTIHAWSLGYELKDKLINNYSEEIYSAHSAMQIALEDSINWSIGANIKNPDFYWNRETRIFQVSNQTVLDFIIQIATSFNAILVWDTINRVVDFQNPYNEEDNRGLKIKYGKYLKSLSKTSSIEEMVTRLKPIGENNLTIIDASVNGSPYLEDFTFFMDGFEMESDQFAEYYFKSKAFVRDTQDLYYSEVMNYSSVPLGAVFSHVHGITGNLSDIISIESVSKAIINSLELFNMTGNNLYLEDIPMFADFLATHLIDADYEGNKFKVLPNTYSYNRTDNVWEADVENIHLRTIYLGVYALLIAYEKEPKETYEDAIENMIRFLSFAHNNVRDRIIENNIEEGFEGLIYEKLIFIEKLQDGSFKYLPSWNVFDNTALLYFSEAWKKYILLFTNAEKTDLLDNIYSPQDIFDRTFNFFNQEYMSGRILMSTTGLPYEIYHYYAPPITQDESYVIDEDTTLSVDEMNGVIANDSDIDSEVLTTILVTQPANGTLTLNPDGSFAYTPNLNFFGNDMFTYKVTDGMLESNVSTVTITVNPVNDPPIAYNNSYVMNEDTTLTTTLNNGVLSNDIDVDSTNLIAYNVTNPTNHSAFSFNADGTFSYTPKTDFYGEDSFAYRVSDGELPSQEAMVYITINNVNDAPIATDDVYTINEDTILNVDTLLGVLVNDEDIDSENLTVSVVETTQNGTLTLNSNGSFNYVPNLNFNGTDSFTYRASDGDLYSNTATVTITVNPVNDPPVAYNNSYIIDEDTTLTTTSANSLIVNATDVDTPKENFIVYNTTNPTNHSAFSMNTDGTFSYTPKPNFYGTDSFSYRISDGSLASNTAIVTITVNPVNDPTIANSDSYTVAEDTTLNVDVANGVTKNDVNVDNDILTVTLIETTENGNLTLNPNGSFQYIPNANFYGTDTFIYKVNDSQNATVTITVTPVTDPQPANTQIYTVVSGDTFADIAYRNNVTTNELKAINVDIDVNNIWVGQQIYIPVPINPNPPTNLTPTNGATSNNLMVSANITDDNNTQVKLVVEASLSSAFLGTVIRKESPFTSSGSTTSITIDGLDFNTINTTVYLKAWTNDKVSDSTIVNSSFIYKVPQPPNTEIYTVVQGDTLSSIAIAYNTTSNYLLELNPIVEEMNVYPSQQIYVPMVITEPTQPYTVESGETFSSIAVKFETTSEKIQELNPTVSPLNVYAGLDLIVPLLEHNMAYVVQEGETLAIIGNKFGTNSDRILAVNPTVSANNIYTGLNLIIPVPIYVYTIKTGDTIADLVTKHSTTVAFVQSANPTLDVNTLTVGNKIYLNLYSTSTETMTYSVVSGDTGSKIATANNITLAKLAELNPHVNLDMIYVGQKLIVPKFIPSSTTYHLISEEDLKANAMGLTSSFETSTPYPNNYGVTAGNFDGMGLSWGCIQFNANTGPLISIWQTLINQYPTTTKQAFMDNPNRTPEQNEANYNVWKDLFLEGDFNKILPWADARTDWSESKQGHAVLEPWKTYFMNVGITEPSIQLQVQHAEHYFNQGKTWYYQLGFWSRRAYSLIFDISVQSGSVNPIIGKDAEGKNIYRDIIGEINTWYSALDKTGKTPQELEILKMEKLCELRSQNVTDKYRANWLDRKLSLSHGSGVVHGIAFNMDDFDLILEPAFADTVPNGWTLDTNWTAEFAEEFHFDIEQYTTEFGNELNFNTNQYMTEFGGELISLDEIQRGQVNVLSPQPKNYDEINNVYGDTWFKMENIIKTSIGYYNVGLYGLSYELSEKILDLKSETDFVNNEIVFFDKYTFEGVGGINGDTSKTLINTGLILQLETLNNETKYNEMLRQTLLNHKTTSEVQNLDDGFRTNIENDQSNISIDTVNEVILPLSDISNQRIISSSPYMSDDLCKAIITYNKFVEKHDGDFLLLTDQRNQKNEELTELQNDLIELETELFIVQDLLDAMKPKNQVQYESVLFVGSPRIVSFEIKKDYKYALMGKSSVLGATVKISNGLTFAFDQANEWKLFEKISFDRTGESTVESSKNEFLYFVTLLGSVNSDIEFQIVQIREEEFTTENNNDDILNKYVEEIHQRNFDNHLVTVNEKKQEIANIQMQIENLQSKLSLYNNFTTEQIKERDLFVITKEYIDEMISNPEDLKNRALEKFKELKNPVVTIEISMVNFLELIEEHYNWDKLDLGTIVNVLYDKFDITIEARIIQMDFDFDNKSISLIISNVKDIETSQEKFIEALYGAVSTSTTVDLEKRNWSQAMEVQNAFNSFVNTAFDATKQKIIAGTNETIEVSRRGLLIKSDTDPMTFLVANSAVLAITNDGGKSYKNAITTDGVIAERLIGKIIAGENLFIENRTGTFRVDGEGVTIEGQGLRILGGITKEHMSEGYRPNVDYSGIVSTYQDTNDENNENATIPPSPTIVEDGYHVQYEDLGYDLVNISFDWEYTEETTGDTDIDGFMIYIYTSPSSSLYTFGTKENAEIRYHANQDKRSIILYHVPKNLYYNFGVEAYRVVNSEIDIEMVKKSPIIQMSQAYNPIYEVPYNGNILGTVDYGNAVKVTGDIITAIRLGQPYSNVTIDPNNGLVAENNLKTQKFILNEEGFKLQKFETDRYVDVLYGDQDGNLVAESLIANRLVVNDGTGRELINAHTNQINFDNFDVVTGNIHADNIDLRGLMVLNDNGDMTLTIDQNGNVAIRGNITMLGGSITWGVGGIEKPTYVASEVGAITETQAGQLAENAVKDLEIGGENLIRGTDFRDVSLWSSWYLPSVITNDYMSDGELGIKLTLTDITQNKLLRLTSHSTNRMNVLKGQTYTMSFIIESSPELTKLDLLGGYLFPSNENAPYWIDFATTNIADLEFIDENNKLRKCIRQFTMWESGELLPSIGFGTENNSVNGSWFKVRNLKIEKGTKATDWNLHASEMESAMHIGLTAPNDTNKKWLDVSVEPAILRVFANGRWMKATPTSATEVGAREITWIPEYWELIGDKPPTNANNTFNELVSNTAINGFYADVDGKLYINATFIRAGEIQGHLIKANTIEGDVIKGGTIHGDRIIAGSLLFTQSQGGFLTLGGTPLGIVDGIQTYENGIFSVRDSAGEEIARLDGDYGGFGTLRVDELLDTKNIVFRTHRESENIDNLTGDIKYHVDPVFGNDSTTTTGKLDDPFMKVQTAIDRLPQYLERNVIIYFKPTLLADTSIVIEGFMGKGQITFRAWNTPVRYIRDWANGNTVNSQNHWTEVRADDVNQNGYYAKYASNINTNSSASKDNIVYVSDHLDDTYWEGGNKDSTETIVPIYVDVDIRFLVNDMRRIKVWHYWQDGRTYHNTKTEVSADRVNWYPLFDSSKEGEYPETEDGHIVYVNKARLYGYIEVKHTTAMVTLRDLMIYARGTNMPCVFGYNNSYLHIDESLLWGDKNYDYVVYCHGGNIRVTDSEIYDAKKGGVMASYGGRLEITNCKGDGYDYGHMAHSSGFTGGAGFGLKGSVLDTYEWEGGLVKGAWNHQLGEFSPKPDVPPPPPLPTKVQRTKTWTSNSSKTYDDGGGYWRSSDNDVIQGKWSSYGLRRGLWFFPSEMRNTCLNSVSVDKVRVYITRANKSGNSGNVNHTLRTHGYASRPAGQPLLSGATQTIGLSRGQGSWFDITGTFKNIFKSGDAWGIGLYTTNTSSSYYSRCTTIAKIEITYTENV